MITNDKQLAIAKEQLARLEAAREAPQRADIPPAFIEANNEKLESDMEAIRQEISEYEALKDATLEDIEIDSFDDLLKAPIKYRLVTHLTVDEFARKVEINPRNIQRYEASEYRSVNLSIFQDLIRKLNLDVHANFIAIPHPEDMAPVEHEKNA